MTKQSWYKIGAKHGGDGDGHAEILIYGEIGRDFWGEGIAAEDLVKDLAELDVATLDVRINSVGGQVFEGLAIFNALNRHPAKVTTYIDGMAASIASIVALAGDTVRIAENAFVMIHNAHGIEVGNASDMRKMADILEKLDGSLVEMYVAKTGKSEKVISAMMDEETWWNAAEALEVGFVDEVVEAMDVAAAFDLSKFHNVRPDVLERAATSARCAASAGELKRFRAGESLGSLLDGLVDDRVTDERSRADVIQEMADAADISTGTVNQIVRGDIDCPPRDVLVGLASALGVGVGRLTSAAESDGCNYDDAEDSMTALIQLAAEVEKTLSLTIL